MSMLHGVLDTTYYYWSTTDLYVSTIKNNNNNNNNNKKASVNEKVHFEFRQKLQHRHWFQFSIINLVYLLLSSIYVDSTENSCFFPQQSIACKVWKYTYMDCSWRELACIPQLRNNASLEFLDLSHNELTVLPVDALSRFIKLHTLDLSSNKISTVNRHVQMY